MKGLKKLFLASMVAVAGLSLASCGGKKDNTTGETTPTTTNSGDEKKQYDNDVLNKLVDAEEVADDMANFVIHGTRYRFRSFFFFVLLKKRKD